MASVKDSGAAYILEVQSFDMIESNGRRKLF